MVMSNLSKLPEHPDNPTLSPRPHFRSSALCAEQSRRLIKKVEEIAVEVQGGVEPRQGKRCTLQFPDIQVSMSKNLSARFLVPLQRTVTQIHRVTSLFIHRANLGSVQFLQSTDAYRISSHFLLGQSIFIKPHTSYPRFDGCLKTCLQGLIRSMIINYVVIEHGCKHFVRHPCRIADFTQPL